MTAHTDCSQRQHGKHCSASTAAATAMTAAAAAAALAATIAAFDLLVATTMTSNQYEIVCQSTQWYTHV
jgi:hypothetical protein